MIFKGLPHGGISLRALKKIYIFMLCGLLAVLILPVGFRAQEARAATGEIIMCSTNQSGEQGNGNSRYQANTPDGKYVAFSSTASNLVSGDGNGRQDIFRKDLQTGEVVRCSTDSSGAEVNGDSDYPSISADGRYVAFQSTATNLVPSDGNGATDIFVKDVTTGGTMRCSTDSSGVEGNNDSTYPSISLDGNYVAFESSATNLVAGDDNVMKDTFRKNISTDETALCSCDSSGNEGNGDSYDASISSDGRYVAFESNANNLGPGDIIGIKDVFRKDLTTGDVAICSCSSVGEHGNARSDDPSLSSDGRYVAFRSEANNLITGDSGSNEDIFHKDIQTGAIVQCSTDSSGSDYYYDSNEPCISPDGRYVAFKSINPFTAWPTSNRSMVYLKDTDTGKTKCCSATSSSENAASSCYYPSVSSNGQYVFFHTFAGNLVQGDSGGYYDVFRKQPLLEPPYISSISPSNGAPGSEVSINGKGFGATRGSSYVSFGPAQVSQYNTWSDSEIKCIVPSGISGEVSVSVTSTEGTSNSAAFNVIPWIESIDPDIAMIGYSVSIIGSGFGPARGNGYVRFDTQEASEYISWSDFEIVVKVPWGVSGDISVRVYADNGQHSNAVPFTVIDYAVAVAEGYTGNGFQEYLCIGNPGDYPANVEIYYLFPDSTYLDDGFSVPAKSRKTIDVNNFVNPYFENGTDVSVVVFSDLEVIVERPMYFSYQGRWTGGHDVMATIYSSKLWFFAEGYTGWGFDEYICVFNPNPDAANLTFYFQTEEAGEIVKTGSVPAAARRTFKVNELLGPNYQCSLVLESDQMIVAERPMYFDYTGLGNHHWEGGHCVMGLPYLTEEYYFAEGTTRSDFEEWLTIQNPWSEAITVIATYQLGEGQGTPITKSYMVPPEHRYTVNVGEEVGEGKDVSVKLVSDSYFLAERPLYFNYCGAWQGGHCVIGASWLDANWFFAEGCTASGFQQWLCLQNTEDENSVVEITYLGRSGPIAVKQVTVPANTRKTLKVNDEAGEGLELSCSMRVLSGPEIVAERPVYFNFQGRDGGHNVVGYNPISFMSASSVQSAGLGQSMLLRDLTWEPGVRRDEI